GALDQIAATDLRRALEQLGSDEIDALLLRDALDDPDPAECEECGRALNRCRDGSGWGHIRQNPDTGQWESIVSTSHTPIARHLPPTRPDIRAGRVYDLSEEELGSTAWYPAKSVTTCCCASSVPCAPTVPRST